VVLPRPFSPTTARRERRDTVIETSCRTRRAPRVMDTPSTRMWALGPAGRPSVLRTSRREGKGRGDAGMSYTDAPQLEVEPGSKDRRPEEDRGRRARIRSERRRRQRADRTFCDHGPGHMPRTIAVHPRGSDRISCRCRTRRRGIRPLRRTGLDGPRARRAISGPWSSSTKAGVRSSAEVIPTEVATAPSRMQIGATRPRGQAVGVAGLDRRAAVAACLYGQRPEDFGPIQLGCSP
jgi:hypothetical protein